MTKRGGSKVPEKQHISVLSNLYLMHSSLCTFTSLKYLSSLKKGLKSSTKLKLDFSPIHWNSLNPYFHAYLNRAKTLRIKMDRREQISLPHTSLYYIKRPSRKTIVDDTSWNILVICTYPVRRVGAKIKNMTNATQKTAVDFLLHPCTCMNHSTT